MWGVKLDQLNRPAAEVEWQIESRQPQALYDRRNFHDSWMLSSMMNFIIKFTCFYGKTLPEMCDHRIFIIFSKCTGFSRISRPGLNPTVQKCFPRKLCWIKQKKPTRFSHVCNIHVLFLGHEAKHREDGKAGVETSKAVHAADEDAIPAGTENEIRTVHQG
jgi:hypothetical protein